MKNPRISRRTVLKGSTALLAGAAFSTRVMASAPPPEPVTPALIEAAKKEGQVIYYTSTDLPVAEKLAKGFEAKYSGIKMRVERTGAERVFQRIGQEYASNIHAVDVVNSSDAAHFIVWKRDGILAPYVPEDVAKFYPAEHKDVDGQFASFRVWLSIIAYNTNLVKAFSLSQEAQQLIIDVGGLRSVHSQIKEKAGRKSLAVIKTMKDDAAAVEKEGEAIKARYTRLFRV